MSLGQGDQGLGAVHLRDAGFEAIEANCLPHDIKTIWFVARG